MQPERGRNSPYFRYAGKPAGQDTSDPRKLVADWADQGVSRAAPTVRDRSREGGDAAPAHLVHNVGVTKHSGSHSAPRQARPARPREGASRGRLLVLAAGITVTLVAWGFLVLAAIDFGREARSGEPTAWGFLALATTGAAACLFVTLILGAKVSAVLRQRQTMAGAQATKPPPRLPGGRRAAR